MDDESSSSSYTDNQDSSSRTWLQRLGRFFSNAPADKQDLMDALSEAKDNAVLDQEAIGMIEGVLEVAEMRVQDVMIPRAQMQVISIEDSLENIMAISEETGHSRFPVIGEDKDDILGILLVKDLLPYVRDQTRAFVLKDLLRKARFIPESKRLNVLLRDFRKTRQHMAIVIDEFGGVAGVITIEDVIEEIIGDIDDEHDEIEAPQIRKLNDESKVGSGDIDYYWLDALYTIDDMNEKLSLNITDEKADTIGGLVALTLGKVPNEGESVTIGPCELTVLKTAKRRIESLELALNRHR